MIEMKNQNQTNINKRKEKPDGEAQSSTGIQWERGWGEWLVNI